MISSSRMICVYVSSHCLIPKHQSQTSSCFSVVSLAHIVGILNSVSCSPKPLLLWIFLYCEQHPLHSSRHLETILDSPVLPAPHTSPSAHSRTAESQLLLSDASCICLISFIPSFLPSFKCQLPLWWPWPVSKRLFLWVLSPLSCPMCYWPQLSPKTQSSSGHLFGSKRLKVTLHLPSFCKLFFSKSMMIRHY